MCKWSGSVDLEIVWTHRYLGVKLENKLEWSTNTEVVHKKRLSRLYFFRRLRSFDVYNWMLLICDQSVVTSTIFIAVVYWSTGIKAKDASRLNDYKE